MKIKLPTLWSAFATILFLTNSISYAQVGINTTTPHGILEVNGNNQGIVLPRIALTSKTIQAPVLNPQGGNIVPGTVVYNTAITSGINAVFPGIYVWTGTEWQNKFTKKETKIYKQTTLLQPASNGGVQNVPGMGQTFTPKYSGPYKMEVSVNFGGGYVADASPQMDIVPQTGIFVFTINGTPYSVPAKTNCTLFGTRYYAIWQQTFIIEYLNLNANTAYPFNLTFDMDPAPGFENSGNSGNGLGYIGVPDHVPCSVEFTYIGN
ncbi:hypothetical protein [Aequorivita sp. CIP111184]|uniref:hypothetical protein n=1 Tax=Aequorivita sp. CIP111184 TaxID=2211356 RepID=UPI000DBBB8A8|nr:hypothetical protein [Aequorivita sp. CIP111184]SRX54227.1 hypothetical protein AEQU1_01234 [Aequorivita sp. CIP111184]